MILLAFLLLPGPLPPPDLATTGIVLGRGQARSVAVLRGGGHTRAVAVGDTAFGGRVLSVEPGGVTLQFGEQRVIARLAGPGGPPAAAATSSRDVSLDRGQVQRRLVTEIPRILGETRLLPYLEQGRPAGVMLEQVATGLLTEAGLQAGDVLTAVNEEPVEGPAGLVALYARLQDESVLRARVLRGGQAVILTVTLR